MARTPRKPKQATQAAALVQALAFVSVAATRDVVIGGAAKHVRMAGNYVVAYDGQMSAGHPIAEELTLCPQIDHLAKALARSGKTLVISETAAGRLSIKGEKLNALVPCMQASELPDIYPDPILAPVDDRIKAAFKCCGVMASERADKVMEATLLLRGGDCTGFNGAAILQFWHGNDLPPALVLPKIFCAAVAAVKEPLVGFGATWSGPKAVSVTFHFEGGAWLKSVTYADEWQSTDGLWSMPNYVATPPELFEAIDAVDDFHEKGHVVFADNAVQSHRSAEIGAQYAIPGLQGGKAFAGKLMKQVAPFAQQIDLTTYPDRVFFMGGEAETPVRGIVMCILENAYSEPVEPKPEPVAEPVAGGWSSPAPGVGFTHDHNPDADDYEIDDDIPF